MLPGLTIRRATMTPADYEAFADLYRLAGVEQPFDNEAPSLDDLHAFDRACERSGAHSWRYLAQDASGATIGVGHFFPVTWLQNPGTYWIVIRVHHALRRRGIGTALLRQMEADLAELGGRALWIFVPEQAPELIEAFERHGFTEQMRSNPFVLEVAHTAPVDLAPRLERLQADHGLRIMTLDECRAEDADWLEKIYTLHAALTREVPIPEKIFTTREEFAAFAIESPQALFDAFFVIRDGDQYVGLSFLQGRADTPDTLYQELTGTLPAYRGKGLARVMKLLTIDYAQRHGFRRIVTWVENTNAGMLAINLSHGFERQPGLVLLERSVAPAIPLTSATSGVSLAQPVQAHVLNPVV